MNEELPMLAMLQAAGPAGVPRSVIVGDLKAGAFWLRMTRLVKSGQAFHVMRGLAPGEVMYFHRKEDAEAFRTERQKKAAREQDIAKAAERKQKRKLRWQVLLDLINGSGPDGIERDALAKAAGISPKSVRGMVSKIRTKLATKCGVRYIDGLEVYFSEQYRPQHKMPFSDAPQKMCEAVVQAGAAGVARLDMLKVVTEFQLKRYLAPMRADGRLSMIRVGRGGCESRYFASDDLAQKFREKQRPVKLERKRKQKAAARARPVKATKTGAQVVFAPAKPKPVPVKAQIINPHGIKPVVLPTPLPRFHVGEVGRHVSANECRPWALYA